MRTLAPMLLVAALAGCAPVADEEARAMPPSPDAMITLSGTALYRERIALPPDAQLIVRISDVSRMDAAAPVIAETQMGTQGRQVPLAFTLRYDPARIDARGRYAVSARILDGAGRLIWITDTQFALPTPGEAITLRLVQVGAR